jgi:superoxide dismutase, Fe-Mn family
MKLLLALCLLCLSLATSKLSLCTKGTWAPSSALYPFSLMPLPYSYNAFEPYIFSSIVAAHHDHHHLTYVTKLNAYLGTVPSLQSKTLLQLVQGATNDASLQKFAGGDFNHNLLWWELTSPACAGLNPVPVGNLGAKINNTFGNFSNFQTQFNTASSGLFGSGWAWLVLDSNNNLVITSTANQLNPIITGAGNPIFGSDLWEHAYYLQYLYNKDNYFANFWNVIDWVQVGYFYDNYVSKGQAIPL